MLLVGLLACSDDATSGPPGNQSTVQVQDNAFSPDQRTVNVGTTVTWDWTGSNAHNVTWVSGAPAASATQSSGTYQRTFDAAGTFTYYCTIHGTPTSGMRGSVVVP